MDAGKCMKLLRDIEKSGTKLICTYCGVETLSVGSTGICSNCENFIDTDRKSLMGTDPERVDDLDAIRKGIANRDFESVISVYEKMRSVDEEPSLMYAEALACIGYSNYEISLIRYDRKGFMEENTALRNKGSEIASKAKLLITKAMHLATDDIDKGNASTGTMYTLFLLQIKLGAMKGAEYMLHELNRVGGYIPEYTNIVFNANMRRYEDMMKHVDMMERGNQLPLNTVYYVALALFKSGNIADSGGLLVALQKFMSSPNVESLLAEIVGTQQV